MNLLELEAYQIIIIINFLFAVAILVLSTMYYRESTDPRWRGTKIAIAIAGAFAAVVYGGYLLGVKWPLLVQVLMASVAYAAVTASLLTSYSRLKYDHHVKRMVDYGIQKRDELLEQIVQDFCEE